MKKIYKIFELDEWYQIKAYQFTTQEFDTEEEAIKYLPYCSSIRLLILPVYTFEN